MRHNRVIGANYLGGWKDGDTVYLDATMIVYGEARARQLGRFNNQRVIYDLDNGKEVDV